MNNYKNLANKQWRHLDTGQTWYDFSWGEYWVCCIHSSMASWLPLWIKSAKNRDKLLTLIAKLENGEKLK